MSKINVLITGGTGSFGQAMVRALLERYPHPETRIIVYSRDELKQSEMRRRLEGVDLGRLRFFVGDVRDLQRLRRALSGVEVVIHAAALKQVPSCEYNPQEAVKTNVGGAINLIEAAIDQHVDKVLALSTDKAVNPVNLYGATKLTAEKLFMAAEALAGHHGPRFACVRYGNVLGSRGSVIPLFRAQLAQGLELTVTDGNMTRFWIPLAGAVKFVLESLDEMTGSQIFVPKLPSVTMATLARAMYLASGRAATQKYRQIGIRPGEKRHEVLVSAEEAHLVQEFSDRFVIGREPRNDLPADWEYASDCNPWRLSEEDVVNMLKEVTP